MDWLSSSASTVPSLDDYFEPNMWNPRLDLLFVKKGSRILAFLVFGIAMAKIALSCFFTLDFTVLQGRSLRICVTPPRTPLLCGSVSIMTRHHYHPVTSRVETCGTRSNFVPVTSSMQIGIIACGMILLCSGHLCLCSFWNMCPACETGLASGCTMWKCFPMDFFLNTGLFVATLVGPFSTHPSLTSNR